MVVKAVGQQQDENQIPKTLSCEKPEPHLTRGTPDRQSKPPDELQAS